VRWVNGRYALLTVLYLAAIYALSAHPDFSIRQSHPLVLLASNLVHAPLFAVLAVLVFKTLGGRPESGADRYLATFAITAMCALSDEWHQSFVPGRLPSVSDLLLDLAGITGALILLRWRPTWRADCRAE
jgi:VanZ family protein